MMKHIISGSLRAVEQNFPPVTTTIRSANRDEGHYAVTRGGLQRVRGFVSPVLYKTTTLFIHDGESWEFAEVHANKKCIMILQPTRLNLVYAQILSGLPSIRVNGGICYQQKKLPLNFTVTFWGSKSEAAPLVSVEDIDFYN